MKKIILTCMTLAMTVLFLASCGEAEKKTQQKDAENKRQVDSLQTIINNQNQEVSDFIASFVAIQNELNIIKQKEELVTINAGSSDEIQAGSDIRDNIQQDIRDIYQLLLSNKKKVQELRNNLAKNNSQYEALVKSLEEQIVTRDQEINELKGILEKKNMQIAGLEEIINSMSTVVTDLSTVVDAKQAELATAYFRMATKKSLQDDGVLDKKGNVVPQINAMFQMVNIKTLLEIPIYASKAEVLTSHPKDSYELVGDKKQIEKLVIKNSDAFWSVEKILVIQVKY